MIFLFEKNILDS